MRLLLAQSCLVKPQQRVVTTSFIYFFIMAKIHDMGRTRTHWIVDQRVDMTSFLSSERILTIFSRPCKQKRSTPFKRTAFTRGHCKYFRYFACKKLMSLKGKHICLRYFASILHLQKRVQASLLGGQQHAYFLQLQNSDPMNFRELHKEQVLIFLEPKTCENLSCLQSTATCVNIRHPDIISFADSECSFRMMELHLLQYMRLSLRVCKFDFNIASCRKKIITPIGVRVQPVQFILGVNCQRKAQHWLLETWMLRVITLRHSYNLGVENIIDYVSEGIQSKKGFQFSLLVSGLGVCSADDLGLGRLE